MIYNYVRKTCMLGSRPVQCWSIYMHACKNRWTVHHNNRCRTFFITRMNLLSKHLLCLDPANIISLNLQRLTTEYLCVTGIQELKKHTHTPFTTSENGTVKKENLNLYMHVNVRIYNPILHTHKKDSRIQPCSQFQIWFFLMSFTWYAKFPKPKTSYVHV